MPTETTVLAAAFDSRERAEVAIDALTSAGVAISAIGVAMRKHEEQDVLIENTGAHPPAKPVSDIVNGGILGGVVGAIISIGVLSVPGVGPVIAGGVLASALAGAGIGAATRDIRSTFVDLGFSGTQASDIEARFTAGKAIVTVEVNETGGVGEVERVRQILIQDAEVIEVAGQALTIGA